MLSDAVLSQLEAVVGSNFLLTDQESLQKYGQDWTRFHSPTPSAVLLPGNIEEVQAIVRLAAAKGIPIVPSGGRTGLSAGAVACNGELVLALDRLQAITDFSPMDRTVRCGAGVATQQLQDFAVKQGLFYPVDFASSGSSQIGGNIATNAGGIKVIRYGMTRDWVAGIKLVDGSGALLDLNRGLIKNNAGYDLRQLVIGAEGTLGVVVEATMRLTTPPADTSVLVVGAPNMRAVMRLLDTFQSKLSLSAFEFFSDLAMQKVLDQSELQRPFETRAALYALLEIEHQLVSDVDVALQLFESCVANGWALDGVISQTESQAQSLWRLRENISEAISRWTPYKNDVSTPVSSIPDFISEVDAVINQSYPDFEVVWFGHIGDGNLHLNVLKPDDLSVESFRRHCDQVSSAVFEVVERYGGSVSAEHGIGLLKKDYLHLSRSTQEVAIMRGIKRAFDPHGIMNPGKIFDSELPT